MPDNMKDFIIFCTNTKGEVVKLRIKNMPDLDERGEIAFLEKKTEHLMNIFYILSVVIGCSMIVSFLWTLKHMDDSFAYMCWIGILLAFIGCCVLKVFLKEIFRKHFIRKNGCEFLQRYLKDYSDQEWGRLKHTVEMTHSILGLLNARTPEGTLVSADPQNQAAAISIDFCINYFKMKWKSYAGNGDQIQKEDLFKAGHVIKNCKLEKDTVEYDFLKNEFRVPLEMK